MNEVQEKTFRQHLLLGSWKVSRWALFGELAPWYWMCWELSFTWITFCRNIEARCSEWLATSCCSMLWSLWRKTEIPGYSLENWVHVGKWCFCISATRHKAPSVKSFFSHSAPLPWSCFSALDRDVLKKAIDEVTCWIATAEEEETMILHNLSGMQRGAPLWHLWALE